VKILGEIMLRGASWSILINKSAILHWCVVYGHRRIN